ncbi:hypothetical protein AJ80_07670 [Polytolypa hystricis UAMH7299]|uniref:DUF7924 domain-containing protein n=1 Tax=Polytolypa hystricis (strain UAMH7299) TaxID=1447883 RepID=A0A2B7XLH8_POLH7|nr:hypothetical protein AJ80_07670 [Polytolypa hystricis UAMH7299]
MKGEQQEHRSKLCSKSPCLSDKQASTPQPGDLVQDTNQNQKRKQSCEDQTAPNPKQRHRPTKDTPGGEQVDKTLWKRTDLVKFWSKYRRWPKRYFEAQPGQTETMSHLLARQKSTTILRRKNSNSSLNSTPSDQDSRDGKSAKYRSPGYETVLATKGSFMAESELGITDSSKAMCNRLLDKKQATPKDTLFEDDRFQKACQKLQGKNEPRVIKDIARLIVPSAEDLATHGAKHLDHLVESVSESWRSSIAFYGPIPQPDYAVGFARSAFTATQLKSLELFIGEIPNTCDSYFLGTFYMHFPFLTCEVKCGASALDIADRQNTHSMTLAVRAVVELFKLVEREKEINREILAFSVSHDYSSVRIYGHYAVIESSKTTFHRHPVRKFDFTELEGKEKWTAYAFIKNLYDIWMPDHLERLCSAIDEIPSGEDLGLSNAESFVAEDCSQPSQASFSVSAEVTPNTSFTQRAKRARK